MMPLFAGLMIPFLGTVLGSGMVYLTKKELNKHFHKFLPLIVFALTIIITQNFFIY